MPFTTKTVNGYVHIEFERSNETTKLVDAIVVGPAEYATWDEAFIEGLIEQRWQNYLIAITPPPEPEPPEGFEFVRDKYGNIVYDENGEPTLVEVGQGD